MCIPIRVYKFHSRVWTTLKADNFHYSGDRLGFGDVYYRHRLM